MHQAGSGHSSPSTVVEHLEQVFAGNPTAKAFIFLEDGEEPSAEYTRAGLREDVLSLAAELQARGATGERALLLYPSGPDFMRAYLACLYAGVVPVPCYPPARNRADKRLDAIARTAEARFALTTERVASDDKRRKDQYPNLAQAAWLATDTVDVSLASKWTPPDVGPDTLALLQFTSGSTSEPRGVMVTHANLLASFHDMDWRFGHDASSVLVTWLPLFHDLGLIYGMMQPLADGHLGVMMPPAAFLQQPLRWLKAISTYGGTHAAAPNFAYDLCASRIPAEVVPTLDLSSWRVGINAAEPIRAETLERFTAHFAPAGLSPRTLSPGYGLAEATLRVSGIPADDLPTILEADQDALATRKVQVATPASKGVRRLVSSGYVPPATRVVIVNPETCVPCAPDEIGEIWVGGRTVAGGYYRDAEATRATFQGRLDGEPGTFLRTGDLGFMRDGHVYVAGRVKDMIILRGLNYYPQDLERTTEASHPGIAAFGCAAFAIEGPAGEALAIVAEVDRATRRQWQPEDIVSAIQRAISDEHGIAADVIAVLEPRTLPKTSSGKVQRRACREMLLNGGLSALTVWRSPGLDAAGDEQGQAPAPAFDLRAWLIERYSKKLHLAPAAIDTSRSLAEFGLDSVEAVSLTGELETLLGRAIPATLAYDYPSIDALVAKLTEQKRGQTPFSREAREKGSDPFSASVAIVGMACRFPGADSPEAFWQLLREGRSAVGEVPPERWDRERVQQDAQDTRVSRYGGFIDGIDRFDAAFFGVAPREALRMDPQQRLVLELGWEALERAGIAPDTLAGSRTGVFVGVSNSDYARLVLEHAGRNDIYAGTGSALSVCANRLSYSLDLKGPSLAVDTACSSSLVSVALACDSLRRGESDLALAGGVNVLAAPDYTVAFSAAGMMAPDGTCKAFDASADGYVRGEGAGLVVLKRLADAERDGDRILAVVRGVATNQDGRTAGLTAPNGPSQQAVVRAALADAGVSPGQVSYVEAHGTGTALGDPIEVNALAEVLSEGREPGKPCLVGSVKTNIGHLESAAGIAGVIKTVLALQHQEVPASLHCATLNPRINTLDAVRIATGSAAWTPAGKTRVAGVSSFGFGGTNAHLVLEEYRDRRPHAAAPAGPRVLTLSARDPQALSALAERHAAMLESLGPSLFGNACFTANTGRAELGDRLGVVAASGADAARGLRAWSRAEDTTDGTMVVQGQASGHTRGVAFLYTGQGAQFPAMGRELFDTESSFRDAMRECDAALGATLGRGLIDLLYGDTPGALDDMRVTQPTIFALQYSLTRLWRAWGVTPAAVIGHSLGEFAAACVAGAMDLDDAIRLVCARGALLQSIRVDGAMVATMASADLLEELLGPWREHLSIAAINGPRNVVFAGRRADATAAAAHLTSKGIKCTMLSIAQASHSPLVDAVLDAFEAEATRAPMRAPALPMVSNVTGSWLEGAPTPSYWRTHLRQTVRFAEGLDTLRRDGYRLFLEIGPHPTLAALGEQIDSSANTAWAASMHRERPARAQMLSAAATLWTRGARVDWRSTFGDVPPTRVPLPTYPFQRKRYWIADRNASPQSGASAPASLPGREVALAAPGVPRVFESRFTRQGAAHLSHVVHGTAFLSSPAFVSAAMTAAGVGSHARVSALEWLRPLAFGDDAPAEVQIVCGRNADATTVDLYSRAGDQGWTHHATCGVSPASADDEPVTAFPGGAQVAPADFYAGLAARGLTIDPAAQILQRIDAAPGAARAEFSVPAQGDPRGEILEAALHCGAAALLDDSRQLVLASADRITCDATAQGTLVATAIKRPTHTTSVDIAVHDATGRVVARLDEVVFRPVDASQSALRDLYAVEWMAHGGPAPTRVRERGTWLVMSAGTETGPALAGALAAQGDRAVHVDVEDGSRRQDWSAAIDAGLSQLGSAPGGVVLLDPGPGLNAALVLQALLARALPSRLWLVTRNAVAVAGDQTPSNPLEGGSWGLGRTIALEHPTHWGGLIDVDGADASATALAIARELSRAGDPDDQVVLRGARRFVPRVTRVRVSVDAPALRPDATYLITGGRGALGLALARALVQDGARHLVLAGRAASLDAAQASAIEELRAEGAVVSVPSLDVRDAGACARLVQSIAGGDRPLAGVIHAAGVPARVRLPELEATAFASAFDAKALGTLNLIGATRGMTLDFFVCVSSMVSAWGAKDQASYVAANAAADFAVAALAANGQRAVSIGLGPLRGGMLPAEVAQAMDRMGVRTWDLASAASMVVRLAHAPLPYVVAASIDWTRFAPALEIVGPRGMFDRVRPQGEAASTVARGVLTSALAQADPQDRSGLLLDAVRREAAGVLGLTSADWTDVQRGFFDAGMDSLTALELRRRLERLLARTLPATLVFDYPNVAALRDALARELPGLFPAAEDMMSPASAETAEPALTAVATESLESTLARLERLVEDR